MNVKNALLLAFASSIVALGVTACSGSVSLENRPCPCATGWTCCEGQNVCVAEGTACPTASGNVVGTGVAMTHLVAKAQSARCMTSDETYVYWQNVDGQIVRAPIAGGDVQIANQTFTGQSDRCGLTFAGGLLYATSATGGHAYSLDTTDKGDGTFGSTVNILAEGLHEPVSIVVDATSAYIGMAGDATDTPSGAIVKAKLGTDFGHFTYLAGSQSITNQIAQDDANVYWIDASGSISKIAKDAPAGTMPTTVLAFESAPPQAITVTGGRVYYATVLEIGSVDPTGMNQKTHASDEHGLYPSSLAVDDSNIYWGGGDGIHKVAIAGGDPIVLSTDASPSALALDATRVHWANQKNEIWTALK